METVPELPWRIQTRAGGPQLEFAIPPELTEPPLVTVHTLRPISAESIPGGSVELRSVLQLAEPQQEFVAIRAAQGFDPLVTQLGVPIQPQTELVAALPPRISTLLARAESGVYRLRRAVSARTAAGARPRHPDRCLG